MQYSYILHNLLLSVASKTEDVKDSFLKPLIDKRLKFTKAWQRFPELNDQRMITNSETIKIIKQNQHLFVTFFSSKRLECRPSV